MDKLLIVGAGGHARAVLDCIASSGVAVSIALLADTDAASVYGFPVIGCVADAPRHIAEYPHACVAVGDTPFRLAMLARLKAAGFSLPVIRHRTAYVSPFASVGEGSVLLANSVLGASVRAGAGCIVNTGAAADHDCLLGDGVHLSPGSVLCGGARVGERSWICAGATVSDHVRVGAGCIIGAGAVVLRDIPDGSKAYGIPARVVGRAE